MKHWQGYVQFKNPVTLGGVKRTIRDPKCHVEPAQGTVEQCVEYCSKSETAVTDTFSEFGKKKDNQGHRSDLDLIYQDVVDGCSAREILLNRGPSALKYINMICRSRAVLFNTDASEQKVCEAQVVEEIVSKQRRLKETVGTRIASVPCSEEYDSDSD